MDRRLFLLSSSAGLLAVTACNAGAQSAIAAIPLDLSGPRPTAQLTIGGAPAAAAIFDSGAAASVLRLSYAQRLGLPNRGPAMAHAPSGAPVQGYQTAIALAKLGNAEFDNALAVALDIPLPLEGVDAIISPTVFSGRLVRFDFAARRADILPINAQNTPLAQSEPYIGGDQHAMLTRTPGVTVHLPGDVDAAAIVDTGSRYGLSFPLEILHRVPLLAPPQPDEPSRMIGVERAAFKATLNGAVRVGALTLQNPVVRFEEGAPTGNVGFEVLRASLLVLDPAGQRSWILAADGAPSP